jgi:hypothetical protein
MKVQKAQKRKSSMVAFEHAAGHGFSSQKPG